MIKTRVPFIVKFDPEDPRRNPEESPEKSWKVFKNRDGFEDQRTKCTNIHDSNILLIVYLEYYVFSHS